MAVMATTDYLSQITGTFTLVILWKTYSIFACFVIPAFVYSLSLQVIGNLSPFHCLGQERTAIACTTSTREGLGGSLMIQLTGFPQVPLLLSPRSTLCSIGPGQMPPTLALAVSGLD